jgi:hypothetical protein
MGTRPAAVTDLPAPEDASDCPVASAPGKPSERGARSRNRAAPSLACGIDLRRLHNDCVGAPGQDLAGPPSGGSRHAPAHHHECRMPSAGEAPLASMRSGRRPLAAGTRVGHEKGQRYPHVQGTTGSPACWYLRRPASLQGMPMLLPCREDLHHLRGNIGDPGSPCPRHLAVLTRPGFVGAAPAIPGASRTRPPPASPPCCDRVSGGRSFTSTRIVSASRRT